MNDALAILETLRMRISAKLAKEGNFREGTASMEVIVAQYALATAMIMQAQAAERYATAFRESLE